MQLSPLGAGGHLPKLEQDPATAWRPEAAHACRTICVDVTEEHLVLKPQEAE